jgi:hypothetical protein
MENYISFQLRWKKIMIFSRTFGMNWSKKIFEINKIFIKID